MSEENVEALPLTSVELLDAAVWREIDSDEAQPAAAFSGGAIAPSGRVRGSIRDPEKPRPSPSVVEHSLSQSWICGIRVDCTYERLLVRFP